MDIEFKDLNHEDLSPEVLDVLVTYSPEILDVLGPEVLDVLGPNMSPEVLEMFVICSLDVLSRDVLSREDLNNNRPEQLNKDVLILLIGQLV